MYSLIFMNMQICSLAYFTADEAAMSYFCFLSS